MKITIIKGEFKGRKAHIISETIGLQRRLCGGPTTEHSITALVDGMLYPIEFSPSEIIRAHIEK